VSVVRRHTAGGEKTMNTQIESSSRIFQTSRRRSRGLLVGVLLVVGYFGTAAVLIRDYTAPIVVTEHVG